jgi:hypothetical protein
MEGVYTKCPQCNGTGGYPYGDGISNVCDRCGGSGQTWVSDRELAEIDDNKSFVFQLVWFLLFGWIFCVFRVSYFIVKKIIWDNIF